MQFLGPALNGTEAKGIINQIKRIIQFNQYYFLLTYLF